MFDLQLVVTFVNAVLLPIVVYATKKLLSIENRLHNLEKHLLKNYEPDTD